MNVSISAVGQPDLEPVWRWYEVQRDLIVEESARVQAVFSGAIAAPLLAPPLNARYQGMASDDLDKFFKEQRERLDPIIMLELLATTEGALRVDFHKRVEQRGEDPISREFIKFAQKHGTKIALDRHILETWKERDARTRDAVGSFRGALQLRHWLAHGRYWALDRYYTPNEIFDIATELLNVVRAAS